MYFKRTDYRRMNTPAWAFSGLGIVLGLLVLVYFVDPAAHRWFKLPGVGSFQPSEFAKPALILFLAYFISRRAQTSMIAGRCKQAMVAVLMLAFMVVVADLGTALVPVITAIVVFWIAGLEGATWRAWPDRRRVGRRRDRVARAIAWAASSLTSIRTTRRSRWSIRTACDQSLTSSDPPACATRAISRGNRRSPWAPEASSAWV